VSHGFIIFEDLSVSDGKRNFLLRPILPEIFEEVFKKLIVDRP
jgi:hypothetical protein